jgi:hypothetical protein
VSEDDRSGAAEAVRGEARVWVGIA